MPRPTLLPNSRRQLTAGRCAPVELFTSELRLAAAEPQSRYAGRAEVAL